MYINTSCVNHGKSDHDRAGSRVIVHLDDAFYNDKIKIVSGKSVALQICEFLSRTFSESKDGKVKRYYHHIPSK